LSGWRLVLARRAAVPASVRRFARRARRRRLKTALPWLAALLVLAFAAIVLFTGVFGVGAVRVEGGLDAEVRLYAAVPHGAPLARLDLAAITRRVERDPPVRRAVVRREWPRTLVVHVWQRVPVAAVPMVGSYALLDADGVPFRQVQSAPPELPLVRLTGPAPGDPTTRAALTVLAALTPALKLPMAALVADSPTRIRLELADQRVIVWGDATDNAAKVRVATSLLGEAASTIDVSAPSVVTVR
jgi:cell division protein FtsQ